MTHEHLEIDHVVLGVDDLDEAAALLHARHGLVALPGGRHPAWGTANAIVPLGPTYLELVAVVAPEVAAGSAFGTWVADMAAGRTGWGWAVRTVDIAATADRLGLDLVPGSRVTTEGTTLRWRLAGVPDDGSDRTLPFFIQWDDGTPLPGTAYAAHRDTDVRLAGLTVEADPGRLASWLGPHAMPVTVVAGTRGVVGVNLATSSGPDLLTPPL